MKRSEPANKFDENAPVDRPDGRTLRMTGAMAACLLLGYGLDLLCGSKGEWTMAGIIASFGIGLAFFLRTLAAVRRLKSDLRKDNDRATPNTKE